MGFGRPRTVTPPDNELDTLGEEMIKWVEENNPIHLSQWWRLQKHFTKEVWKNICDHPRFSPYYEEALNIVGLQYIEKGSDVEVSIKQRWQRVYFKDLTKQEDEDATFAAELAKKNEQAVSPNEKLNEAEDKYLKVEYEKQNLQALVKSLQDKLNDLQS
jgi:hypothetical protein